MTIHVKVPNFDNVKYIGCKENASMYDLGFLGLHSLLGTYQGSAIETLMAEVRRVEKDLKNADFPVDKAHIALFTETRRIASQIYNKHLNPWEGAATIRGLLDKAVGTAECKVG